MNIIESLFKAAQQPPTRPHVGEVFGLWTYYTGVAEARVFCLLLLNHTSDPDLKNLIEHFIDDVEEPQIQKMSQVLRNEGIPMTAITGDKPKSDERAVPPGDKFTDAEVANLLLVKVEGLLNVCHATLSQSLRDDFGAMFFDFYVHLLAQGFTLKRTMRERGWLRVSPFYHAGAIPPG